MTVESPRWGLGAWLLGRAGRDGPVVLASWPAGDAGERAARRGLEELQELGESGWLLRPDGSIHSVTADGRILELPPPVTT